MFYVKRHKSNRCEIAAICDSSLLGRELAEGELCLVVNKSFYSGSRIDADSAKKILISGVDLNLVGNDIVGLALELDIVAKDCVLKIGGVMHAEVCHNG